MSEILCREHGFIAESEWLASLQAAVALHLANGGEHHFIYRQNNQSYMLEGKELEKYTGTQTPRCERILTNR